MTLVVNLKHPDGKPCHWCGRRMSKRDPRHELYPTRDHILPQALVWKRKDLSGQSKNLVWACQACNGLKEDMALGTWHQFMADNPEWWTLWNPRPARTISPSALRNGVPKQAPEWEPHGKPHSI